jgi:hypothetical protein
MDRDKQKDVPQRDRREIDERAEASREELDAIPPPGTDPLHVGP